MVAGQLAVQLDGFLGGGHRVLAAAHLAVAVAEVVQRHGEVRGGRRGWSRPARGTAGRLPRWGPRRPGGGPPRCSGCRGCSARLARSGRKAGLVPGQVPVEPEGFLGGGQGVLAAAHLAVADAEVVQRAGEVGEEGGVGRGPAPGRAGRLPRWGPGRPGGGPPRCSGCRGCSAPLARSGRKAGLVAGQLPVQLDGFLGRGQGVLAAAHLAVAVAEVVQRRWRGRGGRRGWSRARSAVRAGRLPRWGPGRPGGGPPRCSGCRGCSARWRGRGGRRGWSRARSR